MNGSKTQARTHTHTFSCFRSGRASTCEDGRMGLLEVHLGRSKRWSFYQQSQRGAIHGGLGCHYPLISTHFGTKCHSFVTPGTECSCRQTAGSLSTRHCCADRLSCLAPLPDRLPTDRLRVAHAEWSRRSDSGIRNTMLVLRFLHDLEGREGEEGKAETGWEAEGVEYHTRSRVEDPKADHIPDLW